MMAGVFDRCSGGDIELIIQSITKSNSGGKNMKTIRWKKTEYLDIGHGYTAVIESNTSMDGLVMKAYIYHGTNEENMVLVTSNLSPNYDVAYLYALTFRALSNKSHIRKIYELKNHRYTEKCEN